MFKRYRDMSIQNKLFGAFALTILTAAISVATSLGSLMIVQGLSADLAKIFEVSQRAYQAQSYLQELERAEKSFILDGNIEEANNFLVYLALFDDYYRRALLEASGAKTKNALYEIERAKSAYVAAFESITKAELTGEDQGPSDRMIEEITLEMDNMNEQIFTISKEGWDAFTMAVERQGFFLDTANVVNIFSLLVFLLLATFTVFVISRGVFAPAALLSQAAQAVAEKRFEPEMLEPVMVVSDEVGQLAKAFLQMAAAVEAQEGELQAQINEARQRLGSYE